MRLTFWARADPDAPFEHGEHFFQTLSEEHGLDILSADDRAMFEYDSYTARWDQIKVPGWIRGAGNPEVATLYDDIYIASGPNAQARVEIGDAPAYDDSTNLTILTPETWDENTITATVQPGSFEGFAGTFLFVTDATGTRNETGFAL